MLLTVAFPECCQIESSYSNPLNSANFPCTYLISISSDLSVLKASVILPQTTVISDNDGTGIKSLRGKARKNVWKKSEQNWTKHKKKSNLYVGNVKFGLTFIHDGVLKLVYDLHRTRSLIWTILRGPKHKKGPPPIQN